MYLSFKKKYEPFDRVDYHFINQGNLEMSETATRNLPALARSKRAVSEHELRNLSKQISGLLESPKLSNTQEHAPGFSPTVLDRNLDKLVFIRPKLE